MTELKGFSKSSLMHSVPRVDFNQWPEPQRGAHLSCRGLTLEWSRDREIRDAIRTGKCLFSLVNGFRLSGPCASVTPIRAQVLFLYYHTCESVTHIHVKVCFFWRNCYSSTCAKITPIRAQVLLIYVRKCIFFSVQ